MLTKRAGASRVNASALVATSALAFALGLLWPTARPDPLDLTRRETVVLALLLLSGLALVARLQFRRVVDPLRQLSRAATDPTPGIALELTHPLPVREIETLRRTLIDDRLALAALRQLLETRTRTLQDQARHDTLTGCLSRHAYDEDWARYCAEREKTPAVTAYLLFDCDRFRALNDSYGHAVCNRVLALLADAITKAMRAGDSLYRLGDDEFVAFIPDATALQARRIAQRCLEFIEATDFERLGIREPVTLSVGIACSLVDSASGVGDLPRHADVALLAAKQPGHPHVAVFGDVDASMHTCLSSHNTAALFQALAEPGHIEMHYQALYRLPARTLDCFEALARIRLNDTLLNPGAFLPIVASRRLEVEFDNAVLAQIDRDLDAGRIPPGCGVSINFSAQSLSHVDILTRLFAMARHLSTHGLTLEITETSLITRIADVRRDLDRLRELGFLIALDDFGTGFSPVRYLLDLPVDSVKFDISLIKKLAEGGRGGEIVAGLARLMHDAGYPLVAEGIETDADLERAEALGFSHGQGFLLGRPGVDMAHARFGQIHDSQHSGTSQATRPGSGPGCDVSRVNVPRVNVPRVNVFPIAR